MERVVLFALVLLVAACSGEPAGQNQNSIDTTPLKANASAQSLSINDFSLWNRGAGMDLVWASISLQDSQENVVIGRERADFTLTETLLDADGNVVQEAPVQFPDPPYSWYQFDGPGFWERSVGSAKLDVVFLIDDTGSMDGEMPAIRDQLHAFVDRLQNQHIDFRVAGVEYESSIGGDVEPFRGVTEAAEIRAWIDNLSAGGESLDPTAAYDFLMVASDFGFRDGDDVSKMIVVITDTVPQSAYGNHWHLDTTAANRAGAEIALQDKGIEVYYSQPPQPSQLQHLDNYTKTNFNPRAGCMDLGDGEYDCGFAELGERIAWPFDQTDLPTLGNQAVSDSQYFFAWRSGLSSSNTPADHTVKITIQTEDPDNPGTDLTQSFTYTPVLDQADEVVVNVTDIDSDPVTPDLELYYEMADRAVRLTGPSTGPTGTVTFSLVPAGDYRLQVQTIYDEWGNSSYAYPILFRSGSRHISVPAAGLDIDWQVDTGGQWTELARAKGLIRDLRHFGVTEKPFRDFADDADDWLEQVNAGGIDYTDMERIKRLYVALSGYVNTSGYAEVEARRITEDFQQVLYKFRDIIERVRDLAEDSDVALGIAAAEATGRLDVTSLAEIIAGEVTVQSLKEFAESELVPLVIQKIVEQIPAGDHKNLLKLMIEGLILGHWEDWPGLLDTMGDLALDQAMDEVRAQVTNQLVDDVFNNIHVNETAEAQIKILLNEFAAQGFGSGFSAALENAQTQLLALGSRERVQRMVDEIFDQAQDQLEAGPVRDFVLPMTRLLTRAAIQQGQIDNDAVINLLAHYFTHQVILKSTYSQPVTSQLNDALSKAQVFAPVVVDPEDWVWERKNAMDSDFDEFRVASAPGDPFDGMAEINSDTWSMLSKQDSIDDMTQVLSYLSDTLLPVLETLFNGLCSNGYPTCILASDVEDFVAVLDAVGLMTRVLELSLKADDLTHLTDDVDFINEALLIEQ